MIHWSKQFKGCVLDRGMEFFGNQRVIEFISFKQELICSTKMLSGFMENEPF